MLKSSLQNLSRSSSGCGNEGESSRPARGEVEDGRGRCYGAISLFVEVAEAEATMQTSENESTERGKLGNIL